MKGLSDDDNWVDNAKSDKRMDKLGLSGYMYFVLMCQKTNLSQFFMP